MAADRQFYRVGNDLARRQRGLHAAVPHSDAVGDGDGAEFARGGTNRRDALLGCLGLAHQRDIAGGGLIPAGGDADERLVDLLGGQTHGVIERTVRRPLRTFGSMATRQPCLQITLGIHRTLPSQLGPLVPPSHPLQSHRLRHRGNAVTACTLRTHAAGLRVEKSYG